MLAPVTVVFHSPKEQPPAVALPKGTNNRPETRPDRFGKFALIAIERLAVVTPSLTASHVVPMQILHSTPR